MARIVYIEKGQHKTYEFTLEKTTLGRSSRSSVRLLDPLISKIHCVIEKTPEGYKIVDLDSTNGTFVNEIRVKEALLKNNDRIRLGSIELTFQMQPGEKISIEPISETQTASKISPFKQTRRKELLAQQQEKKIISTLLWLGGGLIALTGFFILITNLARQPTKPPATPNIISKPDTPPPPPEPPTETKPATAEEKRLYNKIRSTFEKITEEHEQENIKMMYKCLQMCEEFKQKYPASQYLKDVLNIKEIVKTRKENIIDAFLMEVEKVCMVHIQRPNFDFGSALDEIHFLQDSDLNVEQKNRFEQLRKKIVEEAEKWFEEQYKTLEKIKEQKDYRKGLELIDTMYRKLGSGRFDEFKQKDKLLEEYKKIFEEYKKLSEEPKQ